VTSKLRPADGAWTIEQLLRAESTGQRLKFLPFWGHKPPADGTIGPHVFSQWFAHAFEHDGTRYGTAEHFMMAGKARLFGDDDALGRILTARTPAQAKVIGREVRQFTPAIWDAECLGIVTLGSIAKFSSSPELRAYLLGTGDRVLVEASPRDRIWGIGMGRDNPLVERPSQWRGRNLLGFALMNARAALAQRFRQPD
jgi:ribA/ribD-fused uncharacterized protein